MTVERAHAKLNVFLRVLGRRADGDHDIQTLILPVDLADVVTVEPAEATDVRVGGARAAALRDVGGDSLCTRAVAAFAEATGIAAAASITVDKRIPVGAGMGGGSADAAAVLRALARIHGVPIADLYGAAGSLGADVPALLHGGPVLAEGRGERLTPVHAVTSTWVVVPQPFAVRAADAYAWWDADPATGADPGALLAAVETGNLPVLAHAIFNDLQPGVEARHPEVRAACEELLAAGAEGAIMTGSGPTVVAPVAHLGVADRVVANVAGAIVATGPATTMETSSGVV